MAFDQPVNVRVSKISIRLLHVTSGDLWAGAEVQFFYLCRQFIKSGVDIHALLFNEGTLAARLREAGIPVRVFDESKYNALRLTVKIAGYLRELQPNLVHTHGFKENVLTSAANSLTVRALGVRTAHGSTEIDEPFWRIHKHLFHWLDRWAGQYLQQAIVAVSYPLAASLSNVFAPQKIHVIENTVDASYIQQLAQCALPVDLTKDVCNIAIVGRLVPVKRHDLLLAALALLLPHNPRLHLYIIGDGPLRESLYAQSRQLGVDNNVTFTGELDPVYPMLAQMDLLVMPSDHEGLPMTLLEAMVLGVPVIAHGVGGILRVTHDGELAALVQDHSERGYADAISAALNTPEVIRQRAQRARDSIRSTYTIENKYTEYLELYQRLLEQRN